MNLLVSAVLGYLLGSVPFGLLIVKWIKGIDLRTFGSGNIGATNAMRVHRIGDAVAGAAPAYTGPLDDEAIGFPR